MKEQFISFETAKLAKEKGFNVECYDCYNSRGMSFSNGWCEFISEKDVPIPFDYTDLKMANLTEYILKPTQSLLQKWIRDTHKIHMTITSISQESWQYHITRVGEKLGDNCGEDYADYEAALEDGLLKALKLI